MKSFYRAILAAKLFPRDRELAIRDTQKHFAYVSPRIFIVCMRTTALEVTLITNVVIILSEEQRIATFRSYFVEFQHASRSFLMPSHG